MLGERLDNRMRHLVKWARRQGIACFRLYERDIPEFPMIVDWYGDEGWCDDPKAGGDAVAWFFHRTKDDTLEKERAYRVDAEAEILAGLNIPRDRLFIKYRGRQRSDEGGRDQYERFDSRGAVKVVREHGLRFEVNLSDYLDTGLFLDHRQTRAMVRDEARGKRVLNLFCYTGSFSVYAAAGGAYETTSVDLSNTYLDWTRRNLAANGFRDTGQHRIVRDETRAFLEHRARRGEPPFDLVVADPPTFSRSARSETPWDIQRDHVAFLDLVARNLAPDGVVYFATNARRFRLDADLPVRFTTVQEITRRTIPEDFRNERIHRAWRLVAGPASPAGHPARARRASPPA